MIGDTLSHASLAGITLGLAAGQNPVLGAFVFTAASGALIEFLRGHFKKNTDLILSIVLALCVGTAITIIQKLVRQGDPRELRTRSGGGHIHVARPGEDRAIAQAIGGQQHAPQSATARE